jgi:hypothetical protein
MSSGVHVRWVLRAVRLAIVAAALAGCNMPASGGAGPAVWLDRPLQGYHAPLTEPLTLQAHASDPAGVNQFEFLVFDTSLGIVSAGGASFEEASMEWQAPGPGVYRLGVRARNTEGTLGATTWVEVTIGGVAAPSATPTPAPAVQECSEQALVAPALVSPADGSQLPGSPELAWSYPGTGCHPASFLVDISPDASFADDTLGFGTLDYNETSRTWPLPGDACYFWRARAAVPETSGAPSETWKFCIGALAEETNGPTFTLAQNANCRAGPGTAFDSVDTLMQGDSAAIEGRNEDSSWFFVKRTSGGQCWVSAVVGNVLGDSLLVPIIQVAALEPPPQPVENPPEPQKPPDTTPPTVTSLSVRPPTISQQGCGSQDTATISAMVTDESGIAQVVYAWSDVPTHDDADGYLLPDNMDYANPHFQVALGPFASARKVQVWIFAVDNSENLNELKLGPLSFDVVCIQ